MKTLVILALTFASFSTFAKVKTLKVEYKQGDAVLEGFIAFDDAKKGPMPAVLIVHDWMGPGEYTERRAREIAELGYVGFAVDVYGKGQHPKDQKEAGPLAEKFKNDRALLRARMQAALDYVKAQKNVNAQKIATMGYCFGGTAALELARGGAPIAAVASFHGGLSTPHPEDAKNIKGKVLVMTGGLDPYVKDAEVAGFKKEMDDAKIDYQLMVYANAVHSFTLPNAGNDPSKGAAYNADADRRSFALMKQFFGETLAGKN